MTDGPIKPPSSALLWTGRVVSALPALALLASGIMKFMPMTPEAEKGLKTVGWSAAAVAPLGVTELIATVLYIIPQTSMLGAILITGYMGGAIATHARIGEPFVVQALIPILAWLGLYLREARLWPLVPWRKIS